MSRVSKIVLPVFALSALAVFLGPAFLISAQENLEESCRLENIESRCDSLEPEECREILEKCEEYYQRESLRIEQDISKTEQEKQSLQDKIYTLSRRIKNLDYQIYQSNLAIDDLSGQMADTEISIQETSEDIEEAKKRLSAIIREIYEEDQRPLVEILLSEGISSFFNNLAVLEALSEENQKLLENIKSLKAYLEGQKSSLVQERNEMEDSVYLQQLQKAENDRLRQDQEYYLELTEEEYQQQLQEKEEVQQKVAEIRHRLFELIGVSEGGIEFGKAIEIGQFVEKITGVRTAFLLAILAQESMMQGKIGQNVGQCYLADADTGNGVYIKTGNTAPRTMHPSRDVPVFLNVIEELNQKKDLARDPYKMPVSCWIEVYYQGRPYGWGGAMGPAQFIPSTWGMYKDRVSQAIGGQADPWEIKDAFLAAGFYLKDSGAVTNEFNAAMRYFSGSSWTWWEEQSYGKPVINRAEQYQKEIDLLSQS